MGESKDDERKAILEISCAIVCENHAIYKQLLTNRCQLWTNLPGKGA